MKQDNFKHPNRVIDQNAANPVSLYDRIHIYKGKDHFTISRKRAINLKINGINYGKLKR